MPKKSTTTKQQKLRSSKRTVCVNTSVTSKTQNLSLKRAIKRLESRKKTVLSVEKKEIQESQPFIQKKEQPLSPFVLSLKKEFLSPQEFIEETSLEPLHINLLTNPCTPEPKHSNVVQTQEDLQIHPEEMSDQLFQDIRVRSDSPTVSLPALKPVLTHPVYPGALRYDAAFFQSISSEAFIAKKTPEDIFAYFDFPEEEEEPLEEIDDIHLEELELPREKPRFCFPSLRLPFPAFGWQRAIASFIGLSFLFVLPLHAMNVVQDLRGTKSALEQTGEEAVSFLSAGAQAALAKNASQANIHFSRANERFQNAKNNIDDLGEGTNFLLSILPMTQASFQTADALVEVGKELSIAGERLSAGYAAMEAELQPTPVSRLNILEAYLNSAIPHLQNAQKALEHVDLEAIPETHRSVLLSAQKNLPTLLTTIDEFQQFFTLATTLLGADGTKRYLIAFQNNTEIRPTGGFLGSFAVLDVSHGDITNLDVPEGGSYDLQGSLKENIVAPLPLQLLSARWEFQDSNWFPDFPTSARQALDFYNSAGGPTIDGVVAVNATFITSLLSLLGPVEMTEYDRTIDSENFLFETQKIVEYDYAAYQDPNSERQEAAPKAFIGDLTEKLLARVKDLDTASLLQILDTAQKGLSQKDIQLYFPNEDIQKVAREFSWTGEVKQTDHDYLMIVDANLGGGKTDLVIDEKVNLEVSVQTDGKILNKLTITRTHNGINGAMFTGVNNVDFLRVYVPQGSKLISASGFTIPDISLFEAPDADWTQDSDVLFNEESAVVDPTTSTIISEESGKTVFGNWVQTKPGETSTVAFTYELPFEISTDAGLLQTVKNKVGLNNGETYSLLVQKQSGILNRETNVTISAPDFKTLWSSDNKNTATFDNSSDSFTSILFSK